MFSVFIRTWLESDNSQALEPSNVLENVYLVMLFLILLVSVCVQINDASCYFTTAIVVFGAFLMLTLVSSALYILGNESTLMMQIFMFVSMGSYFLPVIINCCGVNVVHAMLGLFSYLFLSPTYINIFVIYAFANIHDVTWGNRPTN